MDFAGDMLPPVDSGWAADNLGQFLDALIIKLPSLSANTWGKAASLYVN